MNASPSWRGPSRRCPPSLICPTPSGRRSRSTWRRFRRCSGLETYAEKLKSRGAVKDVDGAIQEVGGGFTADPCAQVEAFEKFLVCAVPDLDKKKDIQALLESLADTCKKDAVTFMTKVRTDCGPLVTGVDKDAKPARRTSRSRPSQKVRRRGQHPAAAGLGVLRQAVAQGEEGARFGDFLLASSDYMEARSELAKTAREEAARITGQELPKEKEKGQAQRSRRRAGPSQLATLEPSSSPIRLRHSGEGAGGLVPP